MTTPIICEIDLTLDGKVVRGTLDYYNIPHVVECFTVNGQRRLRLYAPEPLKPAPQPAAQPADDLVSNGVLPF